MKVKRSKLERRKESVERRRVIKKAMKEITKDGGQIGGRGEEGHESKKKQLGTEEGEQREKRSNKEGDEGEERKLKDGEARKKGKKKKMKVDRRSWSEGKRATREKGD